MFGGNAFLHNYGRATSIYCRFVWKPRTSGRTGATGRIEARANGRMNERTDEGRIGGGTDGRMDEWTN